MRPTREGARCPKVPGELLPLYYITVTDKEKLFYEEVKCMCNAVIKTITSMFY